MWFTALLDVRLTDDGQFAGAAGYWLERASRVLGADLWERLNRSSNSAANASGSLARTRARRLASTLMYCPDATVTFSSPSAISPGR
jgi:hypothetical protein